MQQAFPELSLRRGLAMTAWDERQHWWLLSPEGEIVDPTVKQYPGGVVYQYTDVTDWSEEEIADAIPTGRCLNCGAPCYRDEQTCSEECYDSFRRALL